MLGNNVGSPPPPPTVVASILLVLLFTSFLVLAAARSLLLIIITMFSSSSSSSKSTAKRTSSLSSSYNNTTGIGGGSADIVMLSQSDASPPMMDDDNEKHSKMRRKSQQFLTRAVILVAIMTVAALVVHWNTLGPEEESLVVPRPQIATPQKVYDVKGTGLHQSTTSGNGGSSGNGSGSGDWLQEDTRLAHAVSELDRAVRNRKRQPNVLMEVDPDGLRLTGQLQDATRRLLEHRYGYGSRPDRHPAAPSHSAIRVVVTVQLPKSIPQFDPDRDSRPHQIVLQLGPPSLIPCSVFYYLELARTYVGGNVHRNANHVLQIEAQSKATRGHVNMPFQEYSPEFPHKRFTTGYAGRPSGPGWYISILDNTKNHGPGSQQQKNPHEADALFGKIVLGHDVIKKIHSIPQDGWLDEGNKAHIPRLQIVVPKNKDTGVTVDAAVHIAAEWTEWTPPAGVNNDDLVLTMQHHGQ